MAGMGSMTTGPGMEPMTAAGHMTHMVLIPLGVALAAFGALGQRRCLPTDAPAHRWRGSPGRRRGALVILAFAMVLDISKTSTLGFVIPGMRTEYGISASEASLLPVCALIGAVLASPLWGWAADRLGTRTMLFMGGLGFTGTAGRCPPSPGTCSCAV
jgi:putative MFS transporter